MKYRKLGKTNLMVSEIGLGGIPIQMCDERQATEVIDSLIENGINFIDSARGYTVSEKLIGSAIKGRRDKFIIATKSMARDYEGMKNDINQSLINFQTDYIDLYQMHNLQNMDCAGAIKALKEAKEEGKILHVGVTSHNYDFLYDLIDHDSFFETIQFPYNFIENKAEALFNKYLMATSDLAILPPANGFITIIA